MVHILTGRYPLDTAWLYPALTPYIDPESRVTVLPFGFRRSQIPNTAGWMRLYGSGGTLSGWIVHALMAYGVRESRIEFVNPFEDSRDEVRERLRQADILYFTGGQPATMLNRFERMGLVPTLAAFDGVVIGDSAGALVQCARYGLLPEDDSRSGPGVYRGLPGWELFVPVVHYDGSPLHERQVRHIRELTDRPVLALTDRGAVLAEDRRILRIGDVSVFE